MNLFVEWNRKVDLPDDYRTEELSIECFARVLKHEEGKDRPLGKIITKDKITWAEIRYSTSAGNVLIVVAPNGRYKAVYSSATGKMQQTHIDKEYDIHISSNATISLTFTELESLQYAIQEAKLVLENLKVKNV